MKKLFKTVLFVLLALVSSCQVEEEIIRDETTKNELVVKEYTFEQINKKTKFNASFKTVTKLSSIYQRTNDNGSSNPINFEIDSTTIKEIEAYGKTTYTMFVKNNETPITESFENFIVEVDDNTNNIKAYLIKYYPDSEIENNHEHNSFTFHGETEISEIDYNSDIFMPTYQSSECSWSLKCDYGGSEHSAGANCTQTYLVISCGGGGGSSTGTGGNGGNTGTGGNTGIGGNTGTGGNTGNTGTGGNGSTTGNTTTTTGNTGIVTSTTLPSNFAEAQAQIKREKNFNTALSLAQKAWLNSNLEGKTVILNYLESQIVTVLDINYTNEAIDFAKALINLSLTNDIELVSSQQTDYALFDNFASLETFVQDLNVESIDASQGNTEPVNVGQAFSTKTVNISPLHRLAIEMQVNLNPNFSLGRDSKSFLSNAILGNDWVQNSMTITNENYSVDEAEITIVGYINIGIKIQGFELGLKRRKKITILINKDNGQICCSEVTNLIN